MASWTVSTVPHDNKYSPGQQHSFLMGITKIYKGDIVVLKTDGYVYAAYETGAGGDQFVGVAAETQDNTLGSVGEKRIDVWLKGVFEFTCVASNINTALGLACYNDRGAGAGTPTTVTVTAGAHAVKVGNIAELIPIAGAVTAAVKCRVRIAPFSAVAS